MKNILAIIPARSKSKGVKNKNLKKVNGKELVYYTIKRAKESKLISNIIASTDSKIYSKFFKKHSIWTPSLRPKRLSGDKSKIINTLIYTTKIAEKLKKIKYDYVILLQPTAPNRTRGEIDRCLNKIINSKYDSLISLCAIIYSSVNLGYQLNNTIFGVIIGVISVIVIFLFCREMIPEIIKRGDKYMKEKLETKVYKHNWNKYIIGISSILIFLILEIILGEIVINLL